MMKKFFSQYFKVLKAYQTTAEFVFVLVVACLILAASIVYTIRSGIHYNSEAYKYLAHYLGSSTFAVKIFDFRGNDNIEGLYYRPRDLGNVFNYLDAELVLFTLQLKIPGLVSILHYASLLVITLLQYLCIRKIFGKSYYFLTVLFVIIYLTSPGNFLTGVYSRTTKSVVSIFIVLLIWLLVAIYRKVIKTNSKTLLSLFIISTSASLTDELGLAFIVGFLVITSYIYYFIKFSQYKSVIISFLFSVLFALIYRSYIGPYLVHQAIGLWPTVWGARLLTVSSLDFYWVIESVSTFVDYIRLLFGFVSRESALILTGFIYVFLNGYSAKRNVKNITGIFTNWSGLFLTGAGICISIIVLMALVHPPILNFPWKIHYYVLPFHALIITVSALIAIIFCQKYPKYEIYIRMLLIIFIILNVISLPEYFKLNKIQAAELQWDNTREITDPILKNKAISIKNPETYPQKIKTIEIIRERLKQ